MRVNLTISSNTWTEYDKNKEKMLNDVSEKYEEIPYKITDDKLYLFEDDEVYSSSENPDDAFYFKFFNDAGIEFGGAFCLLGAKDDSFDEEFFSELHKIFGDLQFDVNITDSHGGNNWASFTVDQHGEREFEIEEDD